MSLPNGWEGYDPCGSNVNRPVACGDCGWTGFEGDVLESVWEVHGIGERVDVGEIMPVGTCPNSRTDSRDGDYPCRALVHYSDVEVAFRRIPNVLDQIVEAIDAVQ